MLNCLQWQQGLALTESTAVSKYSWKLWEGSCHSGMMDVPPSAPRRVQETECSSHGLQLPALSRAGWEGPRQHMEAVTTGQFLALIHLFLLIITGFRRDSPYVLVKN